MGFLDEMTGEQMERLETALEAWYQAENRVLTRVRSEHNARFPRTGNVDDLLLDILRQIRQPQELMRASRPPFSHRMECRWPVDTCICYRHEGSGW